MVLSRKATTTEVRLNGRLAPELHVVTAEISAGGRRLDNAVLEYFILPNKTVPFLGEELIAFDQAECEITAQAYDGTSQVIHWGQIAARQLHVSERGEVLRLFSRLEDFHFGRPLDGIRAKTGSGKGRISRFAHELVFNPEYDGRLWGNKSKASALRDVYIVPPEEILIGQKKTARGDEVEPFNLPKAVQYLCFYCNEAQRYVKNPTIAELSVALNTDAKILRNHHQPFGKYLPDQLDALLEPYGYSWCVEYSKGSRKIRVFRRGSGAPRQVRLQSFGEALDMEHSNAEAIDLVGDVSSRVVNELDVVGDYVQVELTVELVPAWRSRDDNLPDSELTLDEENAGWKTAPEKARVHRDWVLNEAGDYNKFRPSITKAKDLTEFIGHHIQKRRKFEPTITLGEDGNPIGEIHGITVEWHDGTAWQSVAKLSGDSGRVQVLEKECGIRFAGLNIPYEVRYSAGAQAQGPSAGVGRVRVTASLRADERVGAVELAGGKSPLKAQRIEIIDTGSRLKHRKIHKSSIYASTAPPQTSDSGTFGGLRGSSFVNDTKAAEELAKELLANWNQASISGQVVLTGCGWRVTNLLGVPLGGILGRGVGFKTTHPAQPPRWPSIVGLRFDFEHESIGVVLDTYRQEALR